MRASRELHLKLSPEQQQLLDEWLLEFERDWSAHSLPNWLKRLGTQSPEFVRAAIVELVKIDLERNWQLGQRESLASYLDKYPSLGDRATVPAELILAEVEVRKQFGVPADREFLSAEYPGRENEWQSFLDVAVTVKPAPVIEKSSVETSRIASKTVIKTVQHTAPGPAPASKTPQQPEAGFPKDFGRYRLLKVLGRGGMGSVYLADDPALNRQCAIKLPHFDKKRDRDILERFTREAQAAASVRHEHICAIYDVGEINGENFISMEYIEGRPLTDYVSPSKPGRQRATVQMVLKLALALKHAHEKQIVHRDLKPANIMIKGNSQPVIMDFGLACSLEVSDKSRATAEGTILGTPAYMSPEQVRGRIREIGPRSDIYSLGVIFYEMLTGRIPFRGSVNAILGQIISEEPAPLSELRPDIDLDLQAICLKMMAKSPAARYQSMGEVAEALTEWLRRVKVGDDGNETLIGVAPPVTPPSPPTQRVDADSQPTLVRLPPPVRSVSKPRDNEAVDQKAQTMLTAPRPSRTTSPRSASLKWWLAGGVGLLLLGIVVIILTRGGNGTLRIEVNDEILEVAINGDEVRITDRRGEMDLEDGSHDLSILVEGSEVPIGEEFTLSTEDHEGQYRLIVQLGDTQLSNERFTINRDGETALTVELVEVATEETPSGEANDAPIVTFHGEASLLGNLSAVQKCEAIDVTADGLTAAILDGNSDVTLWDLASGTGTPVGNLDQADSLAISNDGSLVVATTDNSQICVWDIVSGAEISGEASIGIDDVAISADNNRIIIAWWTTLAVYARAPGSQEWTTDDLTRADMVLNGSRPIAADSSDADIVYFFLDNRTPIVVQWDLATGMEQQRFVIPEDARSNPGNSEWLEVSEDGSRLMAKQGTDTIVWDTQSGELLLQIEDTSSFTTAAISPDGSTALIQTETSLVEYWHIDGKQRICLIEEPDGEITDVAFASDGNSAVLGTVFDGLQIWELPAIAASNAASSEATPSLFTEDTAVSDESAVVSSLIESFNNAELLKEFPSAGHCVDVDGSADGQWAASVDLDGKVMLWDLTAESGIAIGQHQGRPDQIDMSPNGHYVVTAGFAEIGSFHLWDTVTGEAVGPITILSKGWVDVSLTDEAILVAGTESVELYERDAAAQIWSINDFSSPDYSARGIVPVLADPDHPHRAFIRALDHSGAIVSWEFDDDRVARRFTPADPSLGGPPDGVVDSLGLAISADGSHLLTRNGTRQIQWWDARTGDLLLTIDQTGESYLGSLSLSADGSTALIAKSGRLFEYWDLALNEVICEISVEARRAVFLPAGDRALFATPNGLQLWELPATRPSLTLPGDDPDEGTLTSAPRWSDEDIQAGRITAPDLTGIQPYWDDDFSDDKSGIRNPGTDGVYVEIEGGAARVDGSFASSGTAHLHNIPTASNVACRVIAQPCGENVDGWRLALRRPDDGHGIQFTVRCDGTIEIRPSGNSDSREFSIEHPAILHGEETNDLFVTVRGRQIEVYVNRIAVCSPILWESDIVDVRPSIGVVGTSGDVDFYSIKLWPADSIPTLEERAISGEIPQPMAGTGTVPSLAVVPFDADQAGEYQRQWAEYLGVPVTYTNSIGMEFALIPPGTSLMGSPPWEEGRDSLRTDELAHYVTITQPFYMSKCEVTQFEYESVIGINPSAFSATGTHNSHVAGVDTGEFPVEFVTWIDANDYCTRLSELSDELAAGCVYHLPTEAQWEYACRAGTTTAYSDGRATPRTTVSVARLDIPRPTGLGAPNPWGLFDMHGNVWEWCADWYSEAYLTGSAIDPVGPAEGDERVYRGGWHSAGENDVGSAERRASAPEYDSNSLGFRIVLEITPEMASRFSAAPVDTGNSN